MPNPERIDLAISRLPDEERVALAGYAARATWPSGFLIYERGAPADGVFVVLSGRVVLRSRVRADSDSASAASRSSATPRLSEA